MGNRFSAVAVEFDLHHLIDTVPCDCKHRGTLVSMRRTAVESTVRDSRLGPSSEEGAEGATPYI